MFFQQRPPPLTRPVTYFSSSRVTNTSTEVVIDLFSERADGKHVVQRLFTNPAFATKVIGVLEKNVAAYETRFGHIRVARGAAPGGAEVETAGAYLNHVQSTFTESEFFLDCRTVLIMKSRTPETLMRLMLVATPGAIPPLLSALQAAVSKPAIS